MDGLRVDGVFAIWSLENIPEVFSDLILLKSALKQNGVFYVLSHKEMRIPTNKGWINNGINIKALLEFHFTVKESSQLPQEVAKERLHSDTFIAKLVNDKPKTIPVEYMNMLKSASSEYSKKDFQKAKELYIQAYNKYQLFGDALNGLGVVERAMGNVQGAIALYIKAIKLDPLNGLVFYAIKTKIKLIKKRYNRKLFRKPFLLRTHI